MTARIKRIEPKSIKYREGLFSHYAKQGYVRMIAQAMAAGEKVPAILVWERKGRYMLANGHHRLTAARLLKLKKVPCVVRPYPPDGARGLFIRTPKAVW